VNERLCKYDVPPHAESTASAPAGSGAAAASTDAKSIGHKRPASAALARSARTRFTRLSYNGHTSLVQCEPLTGRTHQIRVHLRYIRHPIANDPFYSLDTTTRYCPDSELDAAWAAAKETKPQTSSSQTASAKPLPRSSDVFGIWYELEPLNHPFH
jgi:23S rRNA-/tRNA-specific pseudouridylate synthase